MLFQLLSLIYHAFIDAEHPQHIKDLKKKMRSAQRCSVYLEVNPNEETEAMFKDAIDAVEEQAEKAYWAQVKERGVYDFKLWAMRGEKRGSKSPGSIKAS